MIHKVSEERVTKIQTWSQTEITRGSNPSRTKGFIYFPKTPRLALVPTHPPLQLVPVGSSPREVKRPNDEANHVPASSAEVQNASRFTSTASYAFVACTRAILIVTNLLRKKRRMQETRYAYIFIGRTSQKKENLIDLKQDVTVI